MQSDSPESDPRLQKTNRGPFVGTGYVDPCIVYLESTLPGEIPVLYTCWGRSSREIRKPGFKTCLNLTSVVVIKWRPIQIGTGWLTQDGKLAWGFTLIHQKSMLVAARDRMVSVRAPSKTLFADDSKNPLVFEGAIRFIDSQIEESFGDPLMKLDGADLLAGKLLGWAPVDWPSVADALASLERKAATKPKKTPRKSFFRRLVSSVLGKKTVAA